MYIYIYIYTHRYTYIMNNHINTCVCVCIHRHIYVYMYIQIYLCMPQVTLGNFHSATTQLQTCFRTCSSNAFKLRRRRFGNRSSIENSASGYSLRGGCSGRGVQWIGVVLYNKLVYNSIQITAPCFHCTPL